MKKYNVYYVTDRDSCNMVVEARDEEEARYKETRKYGNKKYSLEKLGVTQ